MPSIASVTSFLLPLDFVLMYSPRLSSEVTVKSSWRVLRSKQLKIKLHSLVLNLNGTCQMATPLLILWCGHYLVSYRTAFFLPPEHDRDLSNLLNEKYLTRTPFPCQSSSLKCDSIRNILDNSRWNLCNHILMLLNSLECRFFFFLEIIPSNLTATIKIR